MLAPRASSAVVCLGCELQLARPRLPALARRRLPAAFSTSTPPTITKVHRHKNKTIRQTTAKLGGLKQLGDDADILVIREIADPERPPVAPEKIELLDVPNILDALQREAHAVTPDDVYRQLESLRPVTLAAAAEPQYVSQTTFVKLVRILTEGFTARQLSQFYAVAKNVQEEHVYQDLLDGFKAHKDHVHQSPDRTDWHPGTTALTTRLPGSGIGRRPRRNAVSKPLLVDRILRDVWKLVLLEEIEAPGELELALRPWQLALLNAGDKKTSLDSIGRSRKAKLEIYWQQGILRITADKNTAEYAANDVEAALANAETKKLHLKPWLPRLADGKRPDGENLTALYSQRDYDMVTAVTRANVQRLGNDQLVIRGLNKPSVTEAEQMLIDMLPLNDPAVRTIDSRKLDRTESPRYLLPSLDEGNSLHHKFRSTKLGRWSSPIARPSNPAPAEDQGNHKKAAEEPAKLDRPTSRLVDRAVTTLMRAAHDVSKIAPDAEEPQESAYWHLEPEFKLTAEFGQVLFPLGTANPNEAVKRALTQTSQSPFWPAMPGLANILTSDHFEALARTEQPSSLFYDFVPAPEQQGFEPSQTFPSLRIQVRTSRLGVKAGIHKINLSFEERVHDVLLPDKATDIRFHRYGRLRLNKRAGDKNVAEWAEVVRTNIESGDRLTAPSLRIEVPNWLLSGSDADADTKGMRAVTYLFSGVQFWQTVTGSFSNVLVSFNTLQSGKAGAKGGSMTAHYDRKSQDKSLRNETEMKAWVKTCLHMVDHITEAGSKTVPVNKVLNPRSETSERKLRRAGAQEEGGVAAEGGDALSTPEPAGVDEVAERSAAVLDSTQDDVTGNQATSIEPTLVSEEATIQHTAAEDTEEPSISSILPTDSTELSSTPPPTDMTAENESESEREEREDDDRSIGQNVSIEVRV